MHGACSRYAFRRMQTQILVFCRTRWHTHPIMRPVVEFLRQFSVPVTVINLRSVLPPRLPAGVRRALVISDDPLAAFMAMRSVARGPNKAFHLFLSLEMYEHQLPPHGLRNSLRNGLFWHAHQNVLRRADWVSFSNEARRAHYIKIFPDLEARSSVLRNWPSARTAHGLPGPEMARLEAFAARFPIRIGHVGAIQPGRDIDSLIRAVAAQNRAALILAGKGPRPREVNAESILDLGELPPEQAQEVFNYFQIGFSNYGETTLNSSYAAPVKVYEYLRANKQVLCNRNRGVEEIEREYPNHFYFYRTAEDLPQLLRDLKVPTLTPVKVPTLEAGLTTLLQQCGAWDWLKSPPLPEVNQHEI